MLSPIQCFVVKSLINIHLVDDRTVESKQK